jgi:hypothetical protein
VNADTSTASSLIFEDLGHLIDAFLLTGAQLTAPAQALDRRGPGAARLVRLQLARGRQQWPVLAWAVIVLENNGLAMTLRTVDGDNSKVTYRSAPTNLLLRDRARWYGDRNVAAVPDGVELCPCTLAVWLTGALADDAVTWRGAPPDVDRPLRLTAPRMSRAVAEKLAADLKRRGWRCSARAGEGAAAGDFRLVIAAADRPKVENWLADWVPRPVWDASSSVPDDEPE